MHYIGKYSMSIIKSFSVGNGDLFYIKHASNNFTIIDCCLNESNQEQIFSDIQSQRRYNDIFRFISTHPDEDHIKGLEALDNRFPIDEFYCVKNNAIKTDITKSFEYYCKLRNKAYSLDNTVHGLCDKYGQNSGINILWPDINDDTFKEALRKVNMGESFNNISPIFTYVLQDGIKVIWFGDMESDFLDSIQKKINFDNLGIDILIAPHHGRESGAISNTILKRINPSLIIIGEAPSEYIHYYSDYETITQNLAGDITLNCESGYIDIYVSNYAYIKPNNEMGCPLGYLYKRINTKRS